MNIKCIGCYDLLQEDVAVSKGILIAYICPRYFPYAAALSGLLRPGSGIIEAARDCPEDPLSHCAVCPDTEITHYGQGIISICREHEKAWGYWLDIHQDRKAHLAPRGRSVKANWIEVFREFVEVIRSVEVNTTV